MTPACPAPRACTTCSSPRRPSTPGDVRRRGEGMRLRWGWAPTPFGKGLFVMAPRGLAGLAFSDGDDEATFADMHRRFPAADWRRDDEAAQATALHAFAGGEGPLPVVLIGSPFNIQVWKALLRIPPARPATYGQIAAGPASPRRLPGHRRGDRGQPDLAADPLPPRHRQETAG
jgi:AraC family transcriptional regulator of adaptative response/methylated-DNA-[protein]-cysteine methyltransferase